jgi:predicted CopG family antitoxin
MNEKVNIRSFYLIYSDVLKELIEVRKRKKFKKMLVSKSHFDKEPLSYDDLLNKLIKLKTSGQISTQDMFLKK